MTNKQWEEFSEAVYVSAMFAEAEFASKKEHICLIVSDEMRDLILVKSNYESVVCKKDKDGSVYDYFYGIKLVIDHKMDGYQWKFAVCICGGEF